MTISDLKSAAILLNRYDIIQMLLGISNETVLNHLAQGPAKLQEVKVGVAKRIALSESSREQFFSDFQLSWFCSTN